MLSPVRHMTLSIFIFAAASLCCAQQSPPASSPIEEPPAAQNLYSSSRTDLDADGLVNPGLSIDSPGSEQTAAEKEADRRGRPASVVTGNRLFSRIGVGAFASPLGIGVGAAASITYRTDLRIAGNFFGYGVNGTNEGVTYKGNLSFRSVQASLDWFPWHKNFHLSPGILFYNQNQVTVNGGVPAGESFSVNGANYYSGAAQPVTLEGGVTFRKTAPMFTLGWGNWVPPGRQRHLSFPFEIGFAYVGQTNLTLNFYGVVCDTPQDVNCREIESDPTVQENIEAQRKKYQNDLDYLRFYPIISGGVVYKF